MKNITITLQKGHYAKYRKMKVYIDGIMVATLYQNETIQISISNEAKSIHGQIDWGKTPHLDLRGIKSGDQIIFKPQFSVNLLRGVGIMRIPVTPVLNQI